MRRLPSWSVLFLLSALGAQALGAQALGAQALGAQQDLQPLDPLAAGPAQRIWSARMLDQQELWFRRGMTLPKAAKTATLVFSCDNRCTVFLNGQQVAAGDDWQKLTIVDVTAALRAGDNVLAVHAVNEGSCAAMAVWLYWQDEAGVSGEIVTGKDWQVSEELANAWTDLKFDDSKWQPAKEQGPTPFGKNVYGGEPLALVHLTDFNRSAEQIAKHLEALRHARDSKQAERALDAIERALMEARNAVWKARQAEAKRK